MQMQHNDMLHIHCLSCLKCKVFSIVYFGENTYHPLLQTVCSYVLFENEIPGHYFLNSYLVSCLLTYLLTYLLSYLLTPWSRFLLEKLTGLKLVKKFPTFYVTRRFITAFTTARHLSLSWANLIQSLPPHPTFWRSIWFPTQTWLRPVTTCVYKPEAANTVRAPDDERFTARNMLSL